MTTVEQTLPGWTANPPAAQPGRHRAAGRAAFTLRRLFYLARHRRR